MDVKTCLDSSRPPSDERTPIDSAAPLRLALVGSRGVGARGERVADRGGGTSTSELTHLVTGVSVQGDSRSLGVMEQRHRYLAAAVPRSFLLLMTRRRPRSTLFPYTTLFR